MRISFLLSLATLTVVFNGLSAQAEIIEAANPKAIASVDSKKVNFSATAPQSNWARTPAELISPIALDSTAHPIPGTTLTSASGLRSQPSETLVPVVAQVDRTTPSTTPGTTTPGTTTPGTFTPGTTTPGTTTPRTTTPGTTTPGTTTPGTFTPGTTTPGTTTPRTTTPGTFTPGTTTPGTTTPGTFTPGTTTPGSTTPGTFTPGTTTPGTTTPGTFTPGTTTPGTTTPGTFTPGTTTPGTTTPGTTTPGTITPRTTTPRTTDVLPGTATRSGPSYIGVGGNIGVSTGSTALGEGSFAVFSKLGLTRYLSVRPTILISENPTLLVPITYDLLPVGVPGEARFSAAPYLGAGAAVSFGDDTSADFLITGGVDVPLSRQLTLTGAVNLTAFDNTAVGLLIGIGYNFSGF